MARVGPQSYKKKQAGLYRSIKHRNVGAWCSDITISSLI